MTRFKSMLDIAVTVLVVVAAGLVIWRQFEPINQSRSRPQVEEAKGTIPADVAAIVRGSGPLALVEFSDFECPFCGQHVREVAPMIRKAFVETGVVREVFVNYPLSNHPRLE
jgi:protein-disulfide isomerase